MDSWNYLIFTINVLHLNPKVSDFQIPKDIKVYKNYRKEHILHWRFELKSSHLTHVYLPSSHPSSSWAQQSSCVVQLTKLWSVKSAHLYSRHPYLWPSTVQSLWSVQATPGSDKKLTVIWSKKRRSKSQLLIIFRLCKVFTSTLSRLGLLHYYLNHSSLACHITTACHLIRVWL